MSLMRAWMELEPLDSLWFAGELEGGVLFPPPSVLSLLLSSTFSKLSSLFPLSFFTASSMRELNDS